MDSALETSPFGYGTDPISYVLAYVPVALAILAMIMAFIPAVILLYLEASAYRSRRRGAAEAPPAVPEPTPG